MTTVEKIKFLADEYAERLKLAIDGRVLEMQDDEVSHYLIYRVLGVAQEEGRLIDVYQNKGRFLYKYAGSFLEAATKFCFKEAFPDSGSLRVANTRGQRPRTFEIDCLVGNEALEIKWKDATTDGDHDVPPLLSSTTLWSPIPPDQEIGREEAILGRANHRVPA